MSDFRAVPTVVHVFRTAWQSRTYAFHLSWPWMAILAAVNVALWLTFPGLFGPGQLTSEKLGILGLLFIPLTLVNLFAFSSIAVNWHRFMLVGEEVNGWRRLRVDQPVWRYIGNLFLIYFVMWIMVVGIFIVAMLLAAVLGGKPGNWVGSLVIVATGLVAFGWNIATVMRLSIKLPAVALQRDYGFRDAWAQTSGNSRALLGFMLLLFAILTVAVIILAIPVFGIVYLMGMESMRGQILSSTIQFMANWVLMIAGVNVLTTLYGIFAEGRDV